jgi:dTDP-4-dehydrorhamnose reductase
VTRLLVTGGSGYLGAYLMQAAAARGWDVYGTYFSRPFAPSAGQALPLDLSLPQAAEALVAELRPDAIVHTACSNRDAANIAAIAPAAQHLARAAQQCGARLVHLSTDMVFDGEHAPYDDETTPAPLGPYGRAKAEAEASVAEHCPGAAIVRPSLIWSLEPLDRQTTWLVDGMRRGERVTLFTDEIRCPVHLHDLAAALLELAARPALSGPFNLGGPQALTRWDFGLKLLEALGLPRGSTVLPGTVAEAGLVRARNLSLRCTRAQTLLNTRVRSVDEITAQARSRRPRYCEG